MNIFIYFWLPKLPENGTDIRAVSLNKNVSLQSKYAIKMFCYHAVKMLKQQASSSLVLTDSWTSTLDLLLDL